MSNQPQKDDALFEALGKSKKRRKNKIIRTVIIIVVVLAVVLVAGVGILQRSVRSRFAAASGEVLSHVVGRGTISTVVSGSGTLANVDTETVSVPAGGEIDEILVEVNDSVVQGDVLATVEMATVRSAMADLQTQIEELDEQISDAEDDTVSSYIQAGVSGRVKAVFAQADTDVASCMVEHGALALISLDCYMALDMETDALKVGDSVTVVRAEGEEIGGLVESAVGGKATILVSDNGPEYEEEVAVLAEDGTALGGGTLYIHNPLAITGYAGTVSSVGVTENQKVYSSSTLFYLTNTSSSANYDSLLRSRMELEETLLELLTIQRDGGVLAPIAGSVFSVADAEEEGITDIAVLSPDVSMSVVISVDESDILSLELGQEADVTVSSVSEDALVGTVTEIDKTNASGSYTAEILLDKIDGMLSGMTASVDVKIQGVEDAIIIPVEALHQTSGGAYVYTSYDEETRQYGGRVDVVAGLSNNNYVEIKSGLREGDTVCYTESESIFDMFANMAGMGAARGSISGGSEGGFGGGERPDMSQMPNRGGNSGGNFGGEMPAGFGG